MTAKRILIIDDEKLIRTALADYLRDEGYEATCAADGVEGLRLSRTEIFDVVLSDLRMPHMDGLQVIRILHSEKPDLPVVVISGTGLMQDVVRAMREGAWDYLSKPIPDVDQIKVVIERVLEKSEFLRERKRYQDEIEQLNKSLAEEVQRQTADLVTQNRSLFALNRVSHAVSHSMEIDEILETALDAAVTAVSADVGVIRLLNPVTGYLYLSAVSGLAQTHYRTTKPFGLGEGLSGSVVKTGQVRVGHQLPVGSWLLNIDDLNLQSYVFVPLRTGNSVWLYEDEDEESQRIIGALGVVSTTEKDYTSQDIKLLTTIGTQIGIAVTRAQYAVDLRVANEQLAGANVELRRLDSLREQFIQNVAHELRTPLALVQGYVVLLAEGDLTPGQQKEALEVASRRVESLVDIVEAITTLQDLGSKSFEFDEFKPYDLLITVCRMASQNARAHDVKLVCNPPTGLPTICGDYTRLIQALHQLLDNACKFSPAGSTVETGVTLCEDDTAMCFWVADQGIGIPHEEHERIFELFYQVDGSTARRFSGMGMGLALVNEIAEAHHGVVEVQSVVDQGSTFTLKIPLHQPQTDTL